MFLSKYNQLGYSIRNKAINNSKLIFCINIRFSIGFKTLLEPFHLQFVIRLFLLNDISLSGFSFDINLSFFYLFFFEMTNKYICLPVALIVLIIDFNIDL